MPTATQEQAIDACAKLLDMGVKAVVHKRGSKGAMLATREGVRFFPACKVEAVDTTAAGDTFNAGFAVGLTMDTALGITAAGDSAARSHGQRQNGPRAPAG